MRKIETKKAPGAIGPYSQAFETNGLVITSGQIPVDPQTGLVPDGIEKQAHQSCKTWQPFWKRLARAWKKSSRPPAFWQI